MRTRFVTAIAAVSLVATACTGSSGPTLTVYSGRSRELVQPLFDRFTAQTGIKLEVRYAGSTDLAATLRDEGANTPADVFFAQDPASLGAVALAGLFRRLPDDVMQMVPTRFSDRDGYWVGTSGRVRVVVYDATRLSAQDLPPDVYGFTNPSWSGRIAIAPSNGSFLAFVAAMIVMRGEDSTRTWLQGLAANSPAKYQKNAPIVAAVNQGEVEAGLVNHYYLLRLRAQGETAAANHFLMSGGPGSLVMPAGTGVLAASDDPDSAEQFIEFLLSDEAQAFFAAETFEYPLVSGVAPSAGLPPLESLGAPDIDLSAIAAALDLATELVAEAGLL